MTMVSPLPLRLLTGALALVLAAAAPAAAQESAPPPLDRALFSATAAAERSTLNRTGGLLTSTVDIQAVNLGTQPVYGPVHALVRFRDAVTGAEVTSGITVAGAQGGFGQPPHQTPYFDLSAQAPDGWPPGGQLAFTLSFTRQRTLNVTYEVTLAGRVNAPPSLNPGGPYLGQVNEPIVFIATANDPDGDPLAFRWDFGDGAAADTAQAGHAFATAGAKTVRVAVSDGRGGADEREVTALVVPGGAFALAHTRAVNGAGHPLAGAAVEESGPDGARSLRSEDSGFVSLGTTAGDYVWKFSAPGHQPVWRAAALVEGEVRLLPSPWLAPDGPAAEVSVLEPTTLGAGTGPGSARVVFPAGAFTQPGTARLTALGPQTLPFPLPFGWSPLAAFHASLPAPPAAPGETRLKLADALADGEFVTVARYDAASRRWLVLATGTASPGSPAELTLPLSESGTYVAVVRDEGTGAPIPGAIGDALPGGTSQELSSEVIAVGVVNPAEKPASLDPEAAATIAQAVFTPATGVLPSSSWFRIAVQETYDLADGSALRTPDYDATVYAYRRPAGSIAPAEAVAAPRSLAATGKEAAFATGEGRPAAVFPLRPQILFGPSELLEARLHVEVRPPLGDGAAALSAQGGVLESGDVRVTVPPDVLPGFAAGSLRGLAASSFAGLAGPGQDIVRAFELNLGGLLDGAALQLSIGGVLDPGADYLLARLVRFPGGSGLAPVQRFRTNAAGALASAEPTTAPRLPGLTGAGQYLLVKLAAPQGLLSGRVRDVGGAPAPGIGVRVAAQPWLSITGADARYFLTAPAGEGTALASHSSSGDGAAATFATPGDLGAVSLDLALGALAPRLLATTPADGAIKVATVTPITLEFSEKLAPASLGTTPVALRADGAAADTPGSATLDLSNRLLTFLPTAPLEPATAYTLTAAATLLDLQNLALDGPRSITFTTAAPPARGAGAQLTLFEPGAARIPANILAQLVGYQEGGASSHVVAHGGPGTAEAEVPVILVNESTNATATVLSKPDGSFASFIDAEETDFVSAVFVNANGTRITIPATKQKFDDGRTGLYRQGGILEAESDGEPVEIIVEPGAVPTRTVFLLEEMGLSEVTALLKDVEPEGGGKVLGGLRYAEQGDPMVLAADVSFPLKPGDIPDGVDPAQATFALTIPLQIDGVTSFQIIDAMVFEPGGAAGRLVTRSPPFIGLLLRQIAAIRQEAGFTDSFSRAVTVDASPAVAMISLGTFMLPVMLSKSAGQKVAGNVVMLRHGELPTDATGEPLAGAFVRLDIPGGLASPSRPGLFRQGEAFAMSERDGRFAFHMADSADRRLIATHPRFPFQRAASSGISSDSVVARTTLTFQQPAPVTADIDDTAAPLISVAQSPIVVPSGTGDSTGAILTLTAVDDLDVVSLIIERDAFLGTSNGEVKDIDLLKTPTLIEEARPAPGRLQARYRIQAEEKGSAIYRIQAVDAAANLTTETRVIVYGDPVPGGDEPATRRLSNAWPPDGATGQALGTPIRLRFSHPLEPADVANPTDWITVKPNGFAFQLASAEASPDRRELTLRFFIDLPSNPDPALPPPVLSLGFSPHVVNDVPNLPDGAVEVEYTITFASPPALTVEGTPLLSGSGAVMMGQFVYSLDRSTASGSVRVYRVSPQGTLVPVQTEELPERPTDIVAIPAYPMREFDGSTRPAEPYLAVFSGGALDIKRLALYRIQPDGLLVRAFNARPPISLSISQVVKAKWDPPFLAFQELGSDGTSISLLNLNSLYIGFRLSQTQPEVLRTLPLNGRPGFDANNDGDFADAGDTGPLPANREGQVFGLDFSWAPLNPDERLRDFDFSADFGLLGGLFGGPAGNGLIMVLGGGAQLDETTARVLFPEDPKRVSFLPRLALRRDGQERITDVALISTVADGAAPPPLLVVDVTNPSAPVLIGRALLPAGSGSLNTIIKRDDGLIALSTTSRGVVLLDPRLLLETTSDGTTAALIKDVPGLTGGGERAFTADASGLTFTANGSALRAALDAPQVEVVTFDRQPFDPAQWKAPDFLVEGVAQSASVEDKMASVLATARRTGNGLVFPAEATDPPRDLESRNHYYALVRAPGAMGTTLELAAAAVDGAGRPTLPNRQLAAPTFLGNETLTLRFVALAAFNAFKVLNFSADAAGLVDSLIDEGIEVAFSKLILGSGSTRKPSYQTDLFAHRVSNDPTHPLFNTYLAGPIVLLAEDVTASRHQTLQEQVERRYLAATAGFWVGLSPGLDASSLIFPFASRQDEELQVIINAGLNLRTLLASARITANMILPFGDKLEALQLALQFLDVELERALQPGINAYVHVGRQRNPLIFIPGIMGSELRVNGEDSKLWVDLTDIGPSLLTTSAAKLELGPDGQPRGPGVNADASDVVRTVARKDMASSLLEFINGALDYRVHKFTTFNTDGLFPSSASLKKLPEFFPFPYDWRQDNAKAAEKLAAYIQLIQSIHPEAENVDIIAHSMGGLVSRRYMLDHPGVVGKLILVASPLLGASKAVYTKREGDLDDFYINLLVGQKTGKNISRYMTGLDQLMPTQSLFGLGFRPVWEHGIDLNGDGFAFGPLDYPSYKSFVDGSLYPPEPAPRPAPISQNNEPFHSFPGGDRLQDDWRSDRSGTQLFHLVGVQTIPNTITKVLVRPRLDEVPEEEARDVSLSLPPVDFTDTNDIIGDQARLPEDGDAAFPVGSEAYRLGFDLEVVRGAGDGTVPLLSAARGFDAKDESGGPNSRFDLNPSRMHVIPIVGAANDQNANDLVGHVPVLVNPITKRWIARILTERFEEKEVPEIAISGPRTTPEGEPIQLGASITHRPAGVIGEPVFTWDLGDGRILRGPNPPPFGYPDNGEYVITCVARFPGSESEAIAASGAIPLTGTGGVAGLTSHVVRVTNLPPAPVITITPASPVRGEPVRLRVAAGDPSPTDSFTYAWTTGENPAGDFETTTNIPQLQHCYALPGTYTVTVRVRDDDGAEGVATRIVQVLNAPVAPAPLPRRANRNAPADPNPVDDDPAGNLEYARIFCSGVMTEENLVRVDHDARPVIGSVDGSVVRDDGGRADTTADGAIQIDLYRDVVSDALPRQSRITVRALDKEVTLRIEYYKGNGQARCFFHTCTTAPDDVVVLTLDWDTLLDIPEEAVRSMTNPTATTAGTIPGCQRSELAADTSFDDVTSEVSIDMILIDQDTDDNVDTDLIPKFISEGTPAASPGISLDPCRNLDQLLFRKLTDRSAHAATAPGGARHVVGQGPDGVATVQSGQPPAKKSAQLTDAEAEAVRSSVKRVFTNAATLGADAAANPAASLFNRFVLSLEDVRIFEQGTGACLWKGETALCNGAYVKGKSDNDYEIMFPAFKSRDRRLDPTKDADRAAFPAIAHTEEVMQGDWYFRLPRGYEEDLFSDEFTDLGPLPDFQDPSFAEYLSRVSHWGYRPPTEKSPDPNAPPIQLLPRQGLGAAWSGANDAFFGTTDGLLLVRKGATPFGEEPEKSPFLNPLSPAQIISYALTKYVLATPEVRAELTDVSFFPFRREHFDFAVMSLEKPPPFGDDPIGDAGMGRSLLLLKWLLEGAFLPKFDGFNEGIEDLDLRTEVHQRLVARAAALTPEAFEWGMYHEFAMLSESADLRVRPANSQAAEARDQCRLIFGDFISAHDDKIMKKAGKAAIRGALGRLTMSSGGRQDVLSTTPLDFIAAGHKSFEHFIEFKVRSHPSLFSNYGPGGTPITEVDFQHILGAKVGDKPTYEAIRRSPGGVDAFITKCFSLLNQLQRDSADGYVIFLQELAANGAFAERLTRSANVTAIQDGFTPLGGETRSGRIAMHGIDPESTHEAHWSFVVNIRNNSNQRVGPLAIKLDGTTACANIILEASDTSLIIPNKERRLCADAEVAELLTYTRSVTSRNTEDITVSITGIPEAANRNTDNDSLLLESEFLDIEAFPGPDFRAGRLDFALEVPLVFDVANSSSSVVVTLFETKPDGTSADVSAGASCFFIDANGASNPMPDLRLLINRGLVREAIAWPITIIAQTASGVFGAAPFNADVTDLFLKAGTPTEGQENFLQLVRQFDAPIAPSQWAAALAHSSHQFYQQLDTATSREEIEQMIGTTGRIFIATNADQFAGRSVLDLVSGTEDPKRGLFMDGLLPGTPQTTPFELSDKPYNPGRNGKAPGFLDGGFTGEIYILKDLVERCGPANQSLDFERPDGTALTFDCLTLLKLELFHEMNVRFLAVMGNTGNDNQNVNYDVILRRPYPTLDTVHSALFNFTTEN